MLKGARAGDWRAVTAKLERVFGRPKESIALETEESEAERALRELTPEH
jgi:hypothetical protein